MSQEGLQIIDSEAIAQQIEEMDFSKINHELKFDSHFDSELKLHQTGTPKNSQSSKSSISFGQTESFENLWSKYHFTHEY